MSIDNLAKICNTILRGYRYLKNGQMYPSLDISVHRHPTLTASSGLQLGISPSSLTLLQKGLQTSTGRPDWDNDPFPVE